MGNSEKLSKGCHNILINCANLSESQTLLIIREKEEFGWYKKDISETIYSEAKSMGLRPEILEVGEPENDAKNKLAEIINEYDCTIFFARVGDQDRFEKSSFKTKRVMSYVKSKKSLMSSFGSTNHFALLELKNVINKLMMDSNYIEILCPLGTNVFGKINKSTTLESGEVGVLRFPVVVPAPILANNFSGKVALSNYLTPTGSKVYEPNSLKLNKTIFAFLENGKIVSFEGDKKTVDDVENHYTRISNIFNIEKYVAHSWHAGMNPGTSYDYDISENPDRWSNSIFGSPNYLHFHTCGNYAPGEICWMLPNHTIKIDGKAIWENGNLKVHSFEETLSCIDKWTDLKSLYSY